MNSGGATLGIFSMNDLAHTLTEAGLIQFGLFVEGDHQRPVQFKFEMLASYPDVLRDIASQLAPLIGEADRLLCAPDAGALGVALALHTGIPLVISRVGVGDTVELIGAYDIGHPAVYVTNVIDKSPLSVSAIAHAERVGLEVHQRVGIIGLDDHAPDVALITMAALLDALVVTGDVPPGQAAAVTAWMKTGAL